MTIVGDLVRHIRNLSLQTRALRCKCLVPARQIVAGVVFEQPFAHLPCQVQSCKCRILLLDLFDDPKAMAIMFETTMSPHEAVHDSFAFMAEGRMPQIVRER